MVLNIITLVVSLLMVILFRRLDKSNMKISKLRRYSSKIFDDFKKMAESEKRKFSDATIEMDILIKKSSSLTKNLNDSLIEIEKRLKGLDVEKTNLRKVEEDIQVISHAAREVNEQIKFVAEAKQNFSGMVKNISTISEDIIILQSESENIILSFNDKIRLRSRELTDEYSDSMNSSINSMEEQLEETGDLLLNNFKAKLEPTLKSIESVSNINYQIDTLKTTLNDLENSVFVDIKDKSTELKNEISNSVNEFQENKRELFDKLDVEMIGISNKLKNVEDNVDSSKDKLIKTFEHEVNKVRAELDSLSIHAITKKDEIVQATRKEAEEIKKKIEDFDEKYAVLENKLIDTAEEKMDHLDSEYQSVELRFGNLSEKLSGYENDFNDSFSNQSEKVKKEFSLMEQRLNDIKMEIMNYEDHNKIFSRTDELVEKVETSIEQLNGMIEISQGETKNLSKFIDDIDQIRDIRKSVEREIRAYQAKKEKITEAESNISALMGISEELIVKSENLQNNSAKIDLVNNRIDALSESYSELESAIHELKEYEDIISKNLNSVNKSDIIIKTIDSKMKSIQNLVDKSDKRVEKIKNHLMDVEESTLILKSRESEIREVKDKFDELDGLNGLIETRISQIQAMFQKTETLRNEISSTDDRLQSMFVQTDKKMKEFSEFIQAVDNNNPIVKEVRGDLSSVKNINENVIHTVRDLSEKGWDSFEISKKLMIDENSVRFIINTTSM